jgi:DNA-directed RNA polymerase
VNALITNDHEALIELLATFREYRNAMEDRLEKLNELREQVLKDRDAYLRNDVYAVQHEEVKKRVELLDDNLTARINQWLQRIVDLERWQAKMIGIGLALAALMTVVGVMIGRLWR